jgi:hypothetical protein
MFFGCIFESTNVLALGRFTINAPGFFVNGETCKTNTALEELV